MAVWIGRRFVCFSVAMLIIGFCLNAVVSVLIVALSSPPVPVWAGVDFLDADDIEQREWGRLLLPEIAKSHRDPAVFVSESFGMRTHSLGDSAMSGGEGDYDGVLVGFEYHAIETGWPAKSFVGEIRQRYTATGVVLAGRSAVLLAEGSTANPRFAPFAPKPLGVWGNTVFYALVAAAPFAMFTIVRRRRRSRRGRCISCSYDLDDLITCPECGARVTGAADHAAG